VTERAPRSFTSLAYYLLERPFEAFLCVLRFPAAVQDLADIGFCTVHFRRHIAKGNLRVMHAAYKVPRPLLPQIFLPPLLLSEKQLQKLTDDVIVKLR